MSSSFNPWTALLSVMASLAFSSAIFADTTAQEMEAANRAYAEGHYEDAAGRFEKMIASHGYSAALCFNLANAESRAGRLGPAILNYERARYLAPADREIDHNLQLARKQAGLETNTLRWWQVALRQLTIDEWVAIVDIWLAMVAFAVLLNAFAGRLSAWFNLPLPLLKKSVKGILFVSIPCFLFFGYVALLAAPLRIEGVIIAKTGTLRLSPFESAEKIGTIPEGELVTVEQKHDDYVWIDARNHHFGWIDRKELEPVIAGSFDGAAH